MYAMTWIADVVPSYISGLLVPIAGSQTLHKLRSDREESSERKYDNNWAGKEIAKDSVQSSLHSANGNVVDWR
jgi:hypothetical protein